VILILQVCAEFIKYNFNYGGSGRWEDARRLGACLMAADCHRITSSFAASHCGGCSWYKDATELVLQNCLKVWIVGIICLGMVCSLVSFSSFVFPIFLNRSHPRRRKKCLIAKSHSSVALWL
jgi:hypothetical protein